jgi:hypothetical protein
MEFQLGGGKADQIPFNILRFAKDNDPLLAEFEEAYLLDREFVAPGFTILRPSDEVLKKLTAEMKKIGAEPPDPKFITQQEKGLVYILKGAIAPGILHASHWYVSLARRAYAIYMKDNEISLLDSETDDAKKQMSGAIATLVMVTQNGSSLFKLKGEMPKGSDPIRPPETRAPISSPLDEIRVKQKKRKANSLYLGGGGEAGCLPCELEGGAIGHQGRYQIMMTLRNGDQKYGIPAYGDNWSSFFVTSFCQFLFEGMSGDSSAGLPEAVKALMTGNHCVDALLLLEPMAETPLRPNEKVPQNHRYLVPDQIVEGWVAWLRGSPDNVQALAIKYRGKLGEMLNDGASKEFTAARTQYIDHMRGDIAKIKDDENAKIAFIKSSVEEIKKLYSRIAKENMFSPDGSSSVKAFNDQAFSYLSARYGDQLTWYLPWATLVFFYCESLNCTGYEKFIHIAQMVPGRDFANEVQGSLVGAGLEAGYITAVGLIEGGFLGYLRAGLDSLSAVGIRKKGNFLIVGGGFSHIDSAYRSFDVLSKRKKPKPRHEEASAADLEEMLAAKGKRKKLKKRIHLLSKKRRRFTESGDEETDTEEEAKRIEEFSATKKKLKRAKLKKKISKLKKWRKIVGGAEVQDAEFEATKSRKIASAEMRLRKSKLKKRLKKHRKTKATSASMEDYRKTKKAILDELEALESARLEELTARGKTEKRASLEAKKKKKTAKKMLRKKHKRSKRELAATAAANAAAASAAASAEAASMEAAKKKKKKKKASIGDLLQ